MFLVRSFDFTSNVIHHLARLLTGPKTTQMCSEDRGQAFANVQPASVSVHAWLLHLDPPPHTHTPLTPHQQAGLEKKKHRRLTWTRCRDLSSLGISMQTRPRNTAGDIAVRVLGQTDDFPPPTVSKWYYLWRHKQHKPNIELLAPSKPSIRIPIGHEICGVCVSVTVDFNNLTVDALITQIGQGYILHHILKHSLLTLHRIRFASAEAWICATYTMFAQ